MSKRCSLVLLTYNGAAFVAGCLDSLLPQLTPDDEVIVVDNGSSDDTLERLAPYREQARVLAQPSNLGYSAGNNIGLAACTGRIQILLNQDLVLSPNWLTAMLATFEQEPQIGIVGCKSHYGDGGTLQHAGGWVERPSGFSYHFGDGHKDEGEFDQLRDVEYVSGFAFAIRQDVLRQLGPLDEAFYPAYGEEIDYCFRARSLGWRVVYQPAAVLTHFHQSGGPPPRFVSARLATLGRLRVILRHWSVTDLAAWLDWESHFARLPHDALSRAALAAAYGVVRNELGSIDALRTTGAGYGTAWTTEAKASIGQRLKQLRRMLVTGLRQAAGAEAGAVVAAAAAPIAPGAPRAVVRAYRDQQPVLPAHPVFGPLMSGAKQWMVTNVIDPKLTPLWNAAEQAEVNANQDVAALQAQLLDLQARLDAALAWVRLLEESIDNTG